VGRLFNQVRACLCKSCEQKRNGASFSAQGGEQRGETSGKIVAWNCVAQYAQPFQELVHLSRGQGEEYNGRTVNGIHDSAVILIVAHSGPAPLPSFQFTSYHSLTSDHTYVLGHLTQFKKDTLLISSPLLHLVVMHHQDQEKNKCFFKLLRPEKMSLPQATKELK
jgi:hypothetical protein